jgi:hypothetical protein
MVAGVPADLNVPELPTDREQIARI